ncbi:MAG: hypothetical protein OXE40_08945 [Gammaproteobacteria bacterium]|nr:hypothetical protein [Gammaproteobacteria bacterium]
MNDRRTAAGSRGHFRPTEEYDGQVRCPWCESTHTRLVSPYGPSVAEMMFECLDCGQGFGWLKWQHRLPG